LLSISETSLSDIILCTSSCIGVGIGHKWSLNSRLGKGISLPFLGEERRSVLSLQKDSGK